MLEIVQAQYFKKYTNLMIIVHHAGAMNPYFAREMEEKGVVNKIRQVLGNLMVLLFSSNG